MKIESCLLNLSLLGCLSCGSSSEGTSEPIFGTLASGGSQIGSGGTGLDQDSGSGGQPESTGGTLGGGGSGAVEDAGSGGTPGSGGMTGTGGLFGAGGAVPACIPANGDCTSDPNGCCNSATCISPAGNPSVGVCADGCVYNSDCASGCCAKLNNANVTVCQGASVCAPVCLDPGESCAANVNGCCSGSTCVSDSTSQTILCRALCSANAECNSGCCSPLSNTGQFVCSDSSYCCGILDASCRQNSDCCSGSVCNGVFECARSCVPDRPPNSVVLDCRVNADCCSGSFCNIERTATRGYCFKP